MAQQHGMARVSSVDAPERGRRSCADVTHATGNAHSSDARIFHDLYWQGHVDGQREPMALLDTSGCLIRITRKLHEALGDPHGAGAALALRTAAVERGSQRLYAAVRTDQPALDAAIARAVNEVAPVAAAVSCLRRDGGGAVIVTFQPLPLESRLNHADGAAATMTLIDPLDRPSAATNLWREAFGLTPSESAVAALIVAGHSLESAAATRSSQAATLRVHLRRVFAKTGTTRQADLVALLLRMG